MTGKIRQSIGRQYAPAELAGLFFAFSAAGWLWEVALHLVFNGELVKRGTMLGPWLPIYGAGGVLAVLLLRRFADKPLRVFALGVALCTVIEYVTGRYLDSPVSYTHLLGGRVEALEEKLKNGVPVQAAQPMPASGTAAGIGDEPPPPDDSDAPDWAGGQEDIRAPGKNEAAAPAAADWPHWPALLEALTGKINTGAHTNLKLSARGIEEDGALVILCEDGITAMLAKAEPTMKVIRAQAAALAGAPVKVKVRCV